MILKNVNKIAVLRANGIGDLVFILPAVESIRRRYPQSKIYLIAKQWHKDFFTNRKSAFDEIIVSAPYFGVTHNNANRDDTNQQKIFFNKMKNINYDIALQMHGGGRYSNYFVNSLGAKMTVGSKTKDAPALDRYVPYQYWQPEILRNIEIVSLIDVMTTDIQPRLSLAQGDLAEAGDLLKSFVKKPFVVFHLGANDPRRRWPESKFAEVAMWLEQKGFGIVVIGSKDDNILAANFINILKRRALDLTGKTSVSGMLGVIKKARLLIANDSGPRHLAESIGTPTASIYWVGNVINAGPATRKNHRFAISWTVNCPVCQKPNVYAFTQRCAHDVSFVNDVTAGEAIGIIDDLIEEGVVIRD